LKKVIQKRGGEQGKKIKRWRKKEKRIDGVKKANQKGREGQWKRGKRQTER
jgi:hypothetical protein